MMVELVFVACLQIDPEICEEKALVFVDVTPMACMMGAQPELAKWSNQNPRWNVSGWKCGVVDTSRAEI